MKPSNFNAVSPSIANPIITPATPIENSAPSPNSSGPVLGPTFAEKAALATATSTTAVGAVGLGVQNHQHQGTIARNRINKIQKIREDYAAEKITISTATENYRDLGLNKERIITELKRGGMLENGVSYTIEEKDACYVIVKLPDQVPLEKTSYPDAMHNLNLAQESLSKCEKATNNLHDKLPPDHQDCTEREFHQSIESCHQARKGIKNAQTELSGHSVPESQATQIAEQTINALEAGDNAQAQQENYATTLAQQEQPFLPPLSKRPRRGTFGSLSDGFLNYNSNTMSTGSTEESSVNVPKYTIGLPAPNKTSQEPQKNTSNGFLPWTILLLGVSLAASITFFVLRSRRLKQEENHYVTVLYRYGSKNLSFLEAKQILIENFKFTEKHALEMLQKV